MLLEEVGELDPLTASGASYYSEGTWTKMPWAGAALTASVAGASFPGFGTVGGSYYSGKSFTRGGFRIKYVSGGMVNERYAGLWVCLASAHNGYRCKFLDLAAANEWKAIIYKVTEGVETVLVESAAQIATLTGAELGILNNAGTLEAWWKPEGGSWTLLASKADATYTTGFYGIDGSGSNPKFTGMFGGESAGGKLLPCIV